MFSYTFNTIVLFIFVCIKLTGSTFFQRPQGCPVVQWMFRPQCGLRPRCPTIECRLLRSIVLGYCCGCALPIDKVPMVCPLDVQCPTTMDDLDPICKEYNYLMDCCC